MNSLDFWSAASIAALDCFGFFVGAATSDSVNWTTSRKKIQNQPPALG
jgi:hypothetical protein